MPRLPEPHEKVGQNPIQQSCTHRWDVSENRISMRSGARAQGNVAAPMVLPLAFRYLPFPPIPLGLVARISCSSFHTPCNPFYTSLPLSDFVSSLHAHHQPLFLRVCDVACGCQPDATRGRAAGPRPLSLIPVVGSLAGGPSLSLFLSQSQPQSQSKMG